MDSPILRAACFGPVETDRTVGPDTHCGDSCGLYTLHHESAHHIPSAALADSQVLSPCAAIVRMSFDHDEPSGMRYEP